MQTTEHHYILNFTGKGHLYIYTVVPGNRFYFTDPLNTVFFSILTLHFIFLSLLLSFSCRIRVPFLQVCNHQLDHTDQGGSRYKLKYSTEGVKQKCEMVFHWRISDTSKKIKLTKEHIHLCLKPCYHNRKLQMGFEHTQFVHKYGGI